MSLVGLMSLVGQWVWWVKGSVKSVGLVSLVSLVGLSSLVGLVSLVGLLSQWVW